MLTIAIRAAMAAALCCLSASAFAGQWVEVPSGYPNLKKIEYRSDKLVPGEGIIVHGGTQIPDTEAECGQYAGVSASEMRLVFIHREPITGFEGISLRADREGDDLLDLYIDGPAPAGSSFLNPPGSCGMHDRPSQNQCQHACYRSREDGMTGANPVDCASGEGRWIAVAMVMAFCHDTGAQMPEGLARSNFMMIKVKSSSFSSSNVPIDDVFRSTLWSER